MLVMKLILVFFLCLIKSGLAAKPRITQISQPDDVTEGDNLILECIIENGENYPVIWIKFSKIIPSQHFVISTGNYLTSNDPRVSVKVDDGSSKATLKIENVKESDSGIYSCRIAYKNNEIIYRNIDVNIRKGSALNGQSGKTKPLITYIARTQNLNEGDAVSLECVVQNAEDYPVMWVKNSDTIKNEHFVISTGNAMITRDSRYSVRIDPVSSKTTLEIRRITGKDAGVYSCRIVYTPDEVISKDVIVNVKRAKDRLKRSPTDEAPPLDGITQNDAPRIPPVISYISTPQTKRVGEDATLACTITDVMEHSVMWISGSGTTIASKDIIVIGNPRYVASRNPSSSTYYLRIRNLQESDSNIYKCEVASKNRFPKVSKLTKLEVKKQIPAYPVTTPRPRYTTTPFVPFPTRPSASYPSITHPAGTLPSYYKPVPRSGAVPYTSPIETHIGGLMDDDQPKITSISPPQAKIVGEDVVLMCTVENLGHYHVYWKNDDGLPISKDDERYIPDRRFEPVVDLASSRYILRIRNVEVRDSKNPYRCIISESSSSAPITSQETRIQVRDPSNSYQRTPKVSFISQPQEKTVGEETVLSCTVQNVGDGQVVWSQNGLPITADTNVILVDPRLSLLKDESTQTYHLRLSDLLEDDSGNYTCEILSFSPEGKTGESTTLLVRDARYSPPRPIPVVRPNILYISPDTAKLTGESLTLKCRVENAPDGDVMWMKNRETTLSIGAEVRLRDPRISANRDVVDNSYNLVISNLEESDSGTYSCIIRTDPRGNVERDVRVQVRRPSGPSSNAGPLITSVSVERTQNVGDSTTLSCQVQGGQNLQVTWMKDQRITVSTNEQLNYQDPRFTLTREQAGMTYSLTISNIQQSDAGIYSCVVYGPSGPVSQDVPLHVRQPDQSQPRPSNNPPNAAALTDKLKIRSVSPQQVKNSGDTATLSCVIENPQDTHVIWVKDNKENLALDEYVYKQDPRFRITKDPSGTKFDLIVSNLQEQDSGTYTCLLYSGDTYGDSKDIPLQVGRDPYSGGNTVPSQQTRVHVLSKQTVKPVGDRVDLACYLDDADIVKSNWRKVNPQSIDTLLTAGTIKLTEDPRVFLNYDAATKIYTVTISNLKEDDSGVYRCATRLEQDSVADDVQLVVTGNRQPGPTAGQSVFFYPNTSDVVTASENDGVQLECYAGGNPPPRVVWTRPNHDFLPNAERQFVGNVLRVDSIERINAGIYQCVADNGYGSPITKEVQLLVRYPPLVASDDYEVIKTPGSSARLQCDVEGYPIPEITWYKDNQVLNSDPRYIVDKMVVDNDQVRTTLEIRSIDRNQYGKYMCQGSNQLGSDDYTIDVLEHGQPVENWHTGEPEFPPTISTDLENYSLPLRSNIALECNVTGFPLPNVLWYKDSVPVEEGQHYMFETIHVAAAEVQSILNIGSIEYDNYGTYTCRATNHIGDDEKVIELLPKNSNAPYVDPRAVPPSQFPPQVLIDDSTQSAPLGTGAALRCIVRASPISDIVWYKDNVPIKDSHYYAVEKSTLSANEITTILRINTVQSDTYGRFTCRAINPFGVDQKAIDLVPEGSYANTEPPVSTNCELDERRLDELSTKIVDSITQKVLKNLEHVGSEYDKLETVVNELRREYETIDRQLKEQIRGGYQG